MLDLTTEDKPETTSEGSDHPEAGLDTMEWQVSPSPLQSDTTLMTAQRGCALTKPDSCVAVVVFVFPWQVRVLPSPLLRATLTSEHSGVSLGSLEDASLVYTAAILENLGNPKHPKVKAAKIRFDRHPSKWLGLRTPPARFPPVDTKETRLRPRKISEPPTPLRKVAIHNAFLESQRKQAERAGLEAKRAGRKKRKYRPLQEQRLKRAMVRWVAAGGIAMPPDSD